MDGNTSSVLIAICGVMGAWVTAYFANRTTQDKLVTSEEALKRKIALLEAENKSCAEHSAAQDLVIVELRKTQLQNRNMIFALEKRLNDLGSDTPSNFSALGAPEIDG